MKAFAILFTILGLSLAGYSWSASPVNVIFKENRTSMDGKPFQLYTVECSDGQQGAITAWNERTWWCPQYRLIKKVCFKQQLASAKAVCEANVFARS